MTDPESQVVPPITGRILPARPCCPRTVRGEVSHLAMLYLGRRHELRPIDDLPRGLRR